MRSDEDNLRMMALESEIVRLGKLLDERAAERDDFVEKYENAIGQRGVLADALRELRDEIMSEVIADMDWRETDGARQALCDIIDAALRRARGEERS